MPAASPVLCKTKPDGLSGLFSSLVFVILFAMTPFVLGAEEQHSNHSGTWLGPDGELLPFETSDEIEEFLRTARITKLEEIGTGVTKPQRAYLEKDGIKARAIFRDVKVFKRRWMDAKKGAQLNFRDDCIFECAAYELAKLLDLQRVPPTVRRRVRDKTGTLQIWLENAMMETERMQRKLPPPDTRFWAMQHQMMKIFDQLIQNDDRNAGNILIDADWNLWLIDHTRAFRTKPELTEKEKILFCERKVWTKLKNLTDSKLSESLEDYLRPNEIKALLQRRALLVEHLLALIEERGESIVLFDYLETKPTSSEE